MIHDWRIVYNYSNSQHYAIKILRFLLPLLHGFYSLLEHNGSIFQVYFVLFCSPIFIPFQVYHMNSVLFFCLLLSYFTLGVLILPDGLCLFLYITCELFDVHVLVILNYVKLNYY